MHSVNSSRFQMNDAFLKHGFLLHARTDSRLILIGKIRPDDGFRIFRNSLNPSLGNNLPTVRASALSHLDHPIGMLQNLRIMIDEDDRVAVRLQIIHDTGQPLEIIRMKANGRLIENIENTCRAVADRPGKLHTLPLTGGKRRSRPIQ